MFTELLIWAERVCPVLTKANPNLHEFVTKALVPLFGNHPIELGMTGNEDLLVNRLKAEASYRKPFGAAFGGQITIARITKAIAFLHCRGGFNFTGSVDYLGKGFAEVEFRISGLYNRKGRFSYQEPNAVLYEFTHQHENVGEFKAPKMNDGSVATLEDATECDRVGGW
jgi:cytochrome c peroxidase